MWWEVLGIERDATLKEIKRAYAKLIKGAYQSDNQEEIIKIQNAYRSGCEYIRSRGEGHKKTFKPSVHKRKSTFVFNFQEHESTDNHENGDNYEDAHNIDDFQEENINNTYDEKLRFNNEEKLKFNNEEKTRLNNKEKIRFNMDDREFNDIDNTESQSREKIKWEGIKNDDDLIYAEVELHMKNCEAIFDPIYKDMKKRFQIKKWEKLFRNLSSSEKEYFQKYGYKYFNEHYQLPYDIWLVIEQNLKLKSKSAFIRKEKLIFDDKLEYYSYKGYSYEKLEKFFILRSEAYQAYMDMEYKRCLNICDEANKIISKEPGIIKLRGLCNFNLGNYKLSYCNFEELQAYDKYKLEAKRYMADIYWKNKDFEKAEALYEEITIEGNRILKIKKFIKGLKNKIKRFLSESKCVKITWFLIKVVSCLIAIWGIIANCIESKGFIVVVVIGIFAMYFNREQNKGRR